MRLLPPFPRTHTLCAVIFNGPSYTQSAYTYGAVLRFEVGLLYQAMQVALTHESEREPEMESAYESYASDFKLKHAAIDKIFWDNAAELMQRVHQPHAGKSCSDTHPYAAVEGELQEQDAAAGGTGGSVAVASLLLEPSAKAAIQKQCVSSCALFRSALAQDPCFPVAFLHVGKPCC